MEQDAPNTALHSRLKGASYPVARQWFYTQAARRELLELIRASGEATEGTGGETAWRLQR